MEVEDFFSMILKLNRYLVKLNIYPEDTPTLNTPECQDKSVFKHSQSALMMNM